MIKAVIFDMDGLMFDTEKLWEEAFIKVGSSLGYPVTADVHDKTICTNIYQMKEILQNIFGEDFPFDKFREGTSKYMDDYIINKGIIVKPGLYNLLYYLKNNNYKIAIASSSEKAMIYRNLKSANIDKDIFDVIVSGENFKEGKPNPDIYLKVCELLNVDPSYSLVLEDANNGIISGYKAGCITALIPDIDKITDETKAMTNYELNSLDEVVGLLDNRR